MITPDSTVLFPACPTYGFTVDPLILVKIVELESGFERSNRKWAQALRTYSGVPVGQRPERDIESIYYFYLAIGGMATPFRFKDYVDFKSCRLGADPTPVDQDIVSNGASPPLYRLAKIYEISNLSMIRYITRPIGSTVMVANESGVEQDPSLWTLDESTGFITVESGFDGIPSSWGGEFDVYCRFDGQFSVEITNHRIQSATVNIVEKREK